MPSGVKDTGLIFSSKLILIVLAMATQSCLAWLLGPEGRGAYAVCLLFSTFLMLTFVIGCDYAGVYYVASKKLNLTEGILYSTLLGCAGSIVAIVVGFSLIQLPWSFFLKADVQEFTLALALIPGMVLSHAFLQLLTAVKKFAWFAAFSIAISATQLLGCVVFLIIYDWGVLGALLAYFIANVVGILAILVYVKRKFKFQHQPLSLIKLRIMFTYDLRHYVGKISNQVNVQTALFILALFATREEIGLFAVATSLTTRVIMIPDTLSTVLIPRIAIDKSGQHRLVAACARLNGVACGGILLFICIFATPIVKVLFSSAFLPTIALIRILAIGVFVRCAAKIFIPYLLGTNRPGTVSISAATGTIVNIVILILLLPVLGLDGAALAMVTGYVTSSLILTLSFIRASGLQHNDIWIFKRSDLDLIRSIHLSVHDKFFNTTSFLRKRYVRH